MEELNPETAGCSGVTLLQPDVKELNPKIASHLGVHQIKGLLKYAEHLYRQFRQQITKPQLGQYLLSIIRGLQLQAGSTTQELGAFLKTLEAPGQRTKTLGSLLVWKELCAVGCQPAMVQQYKNHWTLKADGIQHQHWHHYASLCGIDKPGVTVSE